MRSRSRRSGVLAFALIAALLAVASCAPASERPVRGAVPGTEPTPTSPGVPPTLIPSDGLRFRTLTPPATTPSPGLAASPSPGASPGASPSVVVAAPIVRTIAPSANGYVPANAPVTLSAVLVGRGADLAAASLSVNGADAGARIDKRTPREWSIHTSQALGVGRHTARVLVRDDNGGAGGFTWQFVVGEPEAAAPTPAPTPNRP